DWLAALPHRPHLRSDSYLRQRPRFGRHFSEAARPAEIVAHLEHMFYYFAMAAPVATLSISRFGTRHQPVPPIRLEEDWAERPPGFPVVLRRDKRDRRARRAQSLAGHRRCSVPHCRAESLPVVLVDSEAEALLCPYHLLVQLDGTPIEGEPMLATASW